jgi:cell division protein FtsW (lipid II flippase)
VRRHHRTDAQHHPDHHDVQRFDDHHVHSLDDRHAMSTVSSVRPRTRRNIELVLLLLAVGIVVLAYVNVSLATSGSIPAGLSTQVAGLLALAVAFHLLLRWKAAYADPLLLPIVTLLNGLGLVMIHRLDLAAGRELGEGLALRQLTWSALAVAIAAAVLWFLRDHRMLRRYTFTAAVAGFVLLVLPLVPGIGRTVYGSRIWIGLGPFTFQPGEIAKIVLAVFFAGYLVQTRDALSLAGRKILGFTMPRARDLGPILVAWILSLGVLVFETDLGSSLLLFGLFVAMLSVATGRISWIAIGMTLFCGGAYLAYLVFGHVQARVHLWLDPFAPGQSDQVAKGLMGMAAGGLLGTGLGRGRPDLTYFAESDFIIPSFGEEIGLIGLFALLILYVLLVERGLRTALGVRDGFGKLLAAGLAFSMALQCFVVVGGVTRVIPLTGLTMPFLSSGGSSLLANWSLVALLLRISDGARRPVEEVDPAAPSGDAKTEVVAIR